MPTSEACSIEEYINGETPFQHVQILIVKHGTQIFWILLLLTGMVMMTMKTTVKMMKHHYLHQN